MNKKLLDEILQKMEETTALFMLLNTVGEHGTSEMSKILHETEHHFLRVQLSILRVRNYLNNEEKTDNEGS